MIFLAISDKKLNTKISIDILALETSCKSPFNQRVIDRNTSAATKNSLRLPGRTFDERDFLAAPALVVLFDRQMLQNTVVFSDHFALIGPVRCTFKCCEFEASKIVCKNQNVQKEKY
jgi:hypothetical protein